MSESSPWKQLSTKTVYQNPWITVREDQVVRPDGSEGLYGVVMTPPSVYVVAVSESQEIHIVGQYRYPTDKYSWEVPAGGGENQDPLDAAKRELHEEAGLTASKWTSLGSFQSMNGISNETAYVFLAEELQETGKNQQPEEGISKMRKVSFPKLFEMVRSGEFDDGQSIAAVMKAALHVGVF